MCLLTNTKLHILQCALLITHEIKFSLYTNFPHATIAILNIGLIL